MIAHDLLHSGVPLAEKVVRTVAVYAVLALLLRLAGKRDLAQLNTFDLVVMLLLSNVVQNAVIGDDNSLVGGLLGAAVLIGLNAATVRLAAANGTVSRLFEGTPTVLIRDGRYDERALRREGLRRADVDAAVRRQNANDPGEVALATLEPGGTVVVTLKPSAQDATQGDVSALGHRLEEMSAKLDTLLARAG